MKVMISNHAADRMAKYNLQKAQIMDCVQSPNTVVKGSYGRQIAQKRLNGYVLRVIYAETTNLQMVVTVYKAKRERYEI